MANLWPFSSVVGDYRVCDQREAVKVFFAFDERRLSSRRGGQTHLVSIWWWEMTHVDVEYGRSPFESPAFQSLYIRVHNVEPG